MRIMPAWHRSIRLKGSKIQDLKKSVFFVLGILLFITSIMLMCNSALIN